MSADELIGLSAYEKCVAIGEAGLDYHYDKSPRDAQARACERILTPRARLGCRWSFMRATPTRTWSRFWSRKQGRGLSPFLLHCFSSGPRLAEIGVELGGYVSFSGILTFKNSEEIRAHRQKRSGRAGCLSRPTRPILRRRRTGAGAMSRPLCGTRRSVLAETIGGSIEEIEAITTRNFFRLFAKVPRHLIPADLDV